MKTILVTGGAGFIGSHTVVELVSAGYTPVIIDNFSNSNRTVLDGIQKITGQKQAFYEGDFQDKVLLNKVFEEHVIEGVIHFAALKAVGESVKNPLSYYRNNVAGFVDLLDVLAQTGVKHIVFSSSCTVYGEPDSLPITEDSPVKPAASPYGATKQMCETILKDTVYASQSLNAIALRYFNPIGAHPSGEIGELPIGTPANLIPFVTQAAAKLREAVTVFGDDYPTPDGSCIRDYIHVTDLAKAHIKALEALTQQKATFYDTCNVGTGKGTSVLEVIKAFEKANGVPVPHVIGPRREGDIIAIYAAVGKGEKFLNWKAEKSLEEALKDAWNWQQHVLKTL